MASSIDELSAELNVEWPSIERARNEADRVGQQIRTMLTTHNLIPVDASFVVSGSLARQEWTHGSDVDWTLLIDGAADPEHYNVSLRIKGRLKDITPKDVGRTETFGELAFSHNLIQYIGGEADTNRNTTRRILLLLESTTIGDSEAYRRVVLAVLQRYLEGDISFITSSGRYKVPRFLLNDIVRYWRIMCVDYATKARERANEGWAIRNVKLRMSRKLIFAAGLLMCFSCQLNEMPTSRNLFDGLEVGPLLSHLEQYIAMPPLVIVADGLRRYGKEDTAREFMSTYDEFLSILDDTEARVKLETLRQEENKTDPLFKRVKVMSDRFDKALGQFFFEDNQELGQLTRTYGVF